MNKYTNKQTITAVLIMTLLYFPTHNMLQPTRGHHQASTLEILSEIYVCINMKTVLRKDLIHSNRKLFYKIIKISCSKA